MTKRLISFLIALCLLIAIPLSARYKYNPFTRKLDYYEPVSGSDLGDLGDVTLTGLATGNVLYYNGTAWVNLATGANTNVLTLAGGVPTWAAPGAPAAHAASHEVGGADLVDHDQLTNYLAAQHLTLPNTIVAVLTDHNVGAHTALGFATLPSTIALVLTDHNLAAHTALGLYDAPGDVDHDLTTNYVAAQHLALPSTIAAVLTDHNLATHTALGIQHPANVFYVSATGGDYATIQAALTAENAGGETFLIGPGTYAGDTIHFSASDQVVKALGHVPNVIVTQADANIVDAGAFTDCLVEGIDIQLTAPTTAINAIQVGTGSLYIFECHGYLATAVALVQADQPALVGFTGAGKLTVSKGNYQYYHTGNTGGGGIKAAFRANFNLAEFHLHKLDVVIITNSGTALVTSIASSTGTALTQMHNCIDIVVTDPNATNVIGLGYHGGAGAHNIQGNHVDVVATANTSYGIYHGGTGTVRSSFNSLHAQDTGGSSYAFYVGAGATLNSHFDDLRSDDGNSIAGTFVQVSSPSDGELFISGDFEVADIFSYDYTIDHNLLLGYLAGEDLTAGQGQFDTFIGEEAGANITSGDNNVAVGYQALYYNVTGSYNTTVGYQAGTGVAANTYEDNTFIGAQAGFATTTGSSNVAVGSYALNAMTTPHFNTVVGTGTAGALIDGGENVVIGASAGVTGTTYDYDVFIGNNAGYSATTSQESVVIGHSAGYLNQTGGENVIIGYSAAYGVITKSHSQNVIIGHGAAGLIETGGSNVIIGYLAAGDITDGTDNIVIGYMAGEGWLDTENEKLVIDVTNTATPLIYGDFSADNITINGDFNVTMDAALDQVLIQQSAVEGTEDQPLIFIDDDRTGTTVNEIGEATIVIDADGTYAFYILDGLVRFEQTVEIGWYLELADDYGVTFGSVPDAIVYNCTNGAEDSFLCFSVFYQSANETSMFFFNTELAEPSGMAEHNNYVNPTMVFAAQAGADSKDYAGVVIGERAQADVTAAHYFDFFAMTGAIDGSADGNATELAAIFRFGASGSTVPTYATTPGDVLFEGAIEVDGQAYFDGDTNQYEDVFVTWADAADHAVIAQSAVEGIENQPLIYIDDDRTGTTVDENSEATIVIDADGRTAINIVNGFFETADAVYLSADVVVNGTLLQVTDSIAFKLGTQGDVWQHWNLNDTADAHWNIKVDKYDADNTTAIVYSQDVYFWGDSAVDDWSSPTFFIINDENADEYDYTAVIIGERGQGDVEVAHYFDFYVTTGTLRGSVDLTTTEIAAIFRFGPNGTGVPDNATTPGDVLFEGSIEVDGNINIDGEVFQGDYVVSAVVNFDDGSPVAICTVADGYVVTDVYIEVTTIWDGNGTITVGDGDDTDGYLRDADIDQTTAAYYGWHLDERGDYLWDGPDHGDHKIYAGADTVEATLVAGTSTQGIATVFVHITRLK